MADEFLAGQRLQIDRVVNVRSAIRRDVHRQFGHNWSGTRKTKTTRTSEYACECLLYASRADVKHLQRVKQSNTVRYTANLNKVFARQRQHIADGEILESAYVRAEAIAT